MKQLHDEDTALHALEGLLDLVTLFSDVMEKGMLDRGLTRARAAVLWTMRDREPMTQRALSELLGVTPRNVTGLVDALEEGEYVTREKHPTDRRAILVTLTQKGIEHVGGMHADFRRWAHGLFGGVPGGHLEAFSSTVDALRAKMRSR